MGLSNVRHRRERHHRPERDDRDHPRALSNYSLAYMFSYSYIRLRSHQPSSVRISRSAATARTLRAGDLLDAGRGPGRERRRDESRDAHRGDLPQDGHQRRRRPLQGVHAALLLQPTLHSRLHSCMHHISSHRVAAHTSSESHS